MVFSASQLSRIFCTSQFGAGTSPLFYTKLGMTSHTVEVNLRLKTNRLICAFRLSSFPGYNNDLRNYQKSIFVSNII